MLNFLQSPPKMVQSFAQRLPYLDYDPESQIFLLNDGVSCGALLEVTPLACEARTKAFRDGLQERIAGFLATLPRDPNPWVLQFYPVMVPSLQAAAQQMGEFYDRLPHGRTRFREQFYRWMCEHFELLANPNGIYHDKVTGHVFRGKTTRLMITLYKRYPPRHAGDSDKREAVFEEILGVRRQVKAFLESLGLAPQVRGWQELYAWLGPVFHPGLPRDRFLQRYPGPREDRLPHAPGLSEVLLTTPITASAEHQGFLFGDLNASPWLSRYVRVRGLSDRHKTAGVVSAELYREPHSNSFLDGLPPHSQWVTTVVVASQKEILRRIKFSIRRGTQVGGSLGAAQKDTADIADYEISQGNLVFPLSMGLYLNAPTPTRLNEQINAMRGHLSAYYFPMVEEVDHELAWHYYFSGLPFNTHPEKRHRRFNTRPTFADDIADLLPVYQRKAGGENAGMALLNRGGEVIWVDLLKDAVTHSHTFVTGPTGSGKSVFLNYIMQSLIAAHNARVICVELGGSFSALGDILAAAGQSTNLIRVGDGAVSIAPFTGALECLQLGDEKVDELMSVEAFAKSDRERLRLSELEAIATLMTTEGDMDIKVTPTQRLAIRRAILGAAAEVEARGGTEVIPSDLLAQFRLMQGGLETDETERRIARELGDALQLFSETGTLSASLFNRRGGASWKLSDFTHFDIGFLKDHPTLLVIAMMTLLQNVIAMAKQFENDPRPIVLVIDEAQEFFWRAILSWYLVKIGKEMRKLGVTLIIATPSLANFSGEAQRVISQCANKIILKAPLEDIRLVQDFYELTDEQAALAAKTQKKEGYYAEGVLFTDQEQILFRVTPPAQVLAAGFTSKQQKAQRQKKLDNGMTLLEAVADDAKEVKKSWSGRAA